MPLYPRAARIQSDVTPTGLLATIGDSITIGNGGATWFGLNLHTLACLQSGGRLRPYINAGVSGNTTAQMLARIVADVITAKNPLPGACIVLGGTNDVAAVATATSLANLTQMYTLLREAGIEPIGATIPPKPTDHAKIAALNAGIRTICNARGMVCLGFHEVLSDPATGNYLSGLAPVDGIHPNGAGYRLMSAVAVAALAELFPKNAPFLTDDKSDTTNMIANGVFVTDTNADGVADSWTLSGSGGTVTPSLITNDANIVGNWQQMDWNAGTRTISQTISAAAASPAGWAVGDVLEVSGLVETVGVEAGAGAGVQVRVTLTGAAANENPLFGFAADVTRGVFYRRFTVPASTTTMQIALFPSSTATLGVGVVKFARLTLINLTRLGLV